MIDSTDDIFNDLLFQKSIEKKKIGYFLNQAKTID
jgi:hypothetical protein